MNDILLSAYISLIIQFITGVISLYGIFIPLPFKDRILREILILETIVQVIEFIFYVWLVVSFYKINYDVTYVRYFDWFWTTPVMILSTIYFFEYITYESTSILDITIKDFSYLSLIVICNFLMLLFGFLVLRFLNALALVKIKASKLSDAKLDKMYTESLKLSSKYVISNWIKNYQILYI
jgi:hypothetical protein